MKPTIHVSVLDGDITVWVIASGHAYPFSTANDAATFAEGFAFLRPGTVWEALQPGGAMNAMHAGEEFVELLGNDDAWWDDKPEALP